MNLQKFGVLVTFLLVSLNSNAAIERATERPRSSLVPKIVVPHNGIYRFAQDTEILPRGEYYGDEFVIDPEQPTIGFTAGEPVHVQFLGSGEVEISIVLNDKEQADGEMPDRILLTLEDFQSAGLIFVSEGDFADLHQNFASYESYKEAGRRRGGFSRRGRDHYRNRNGGSYYGCVAYVCRAIGGCVGRVGNGVGMTSYLRRKGWRSVSCSNPPVGAVASWSGGSHGKGHTAVWNGRGWCYDLGCANPGRKYRLRDCVAR